MEPINLLSPKFNGDAVEHSEHSGSAPVRKSTNLTFSNLILTEGDDAPKYGNELLLTGELFYNREIIIDKNGMVNGLRKKKDGQTFFGLKNMKDYTGSYYNDLVVNYHTNMRNATSTGRVFDISYQKKTNDYRLYMIHNTMIMNYMITNNFYFDYDKDYYIVLGKVLVTITVQASDNRQFIDVIIEEDETQLKYSFTDSDMHISIGRVSCNIIINNASISKKHGVLAYSKEMNMFYYVDKGSINGSVVVLKEDDGIRLKGDMRFKLEEVAFRIMELP